MKLAVIFKTNRIEDDVIVDMSLVDMSCYDILETVFKNSVGKFHTDFMSSFIIGFSRSK